jgi:hypothetical protein
MIPSNLGISDKQAPKTQGSPCCHANIIDRQRLFSSRIYRGCAHCGRAVRD